MCTEDNKLAVGYKDLRWLIGINGSEEGVDGVGHRGYILLTLLLVEEEELAVAMAQFRGGGANGAIIKE